MKWISFLLAVSFAGAGALVAFVVDAELGVILGTAAAFTARLGEVGRTSRAPAGSPRFPRGGVQATQPQTTSVTVDSLTGTYARLLSELPILRPKALSGHERRLRVARITQQLAEAHWALEDARARAKWTLPGWTRPRDELSIRKDWTHRFSRRLSEHEPAMSARDSIAIARTMYSNSRWRLASPEAAVDLELLELELIGSTQTRSDEFDAAERC